MFLATIHKQAKPRGRLLHNEQFAPFMGSVSLEKASNLHAGLIGAEIASAHPETAFMGVILRSPADGGRRRIS